MTEKINRLIRHIPFLLFGFMIIAGCNQSNDFSITAFDPMINYRETISDTVILPMNLDHEIYKGISLPDQGYFKFSFTIKNNSNKSKKYFYKIFYRNESYKFSETDTVDKKIAFNPYASENFYGSWEDVADSLHTTPLIPADNNDYIVTDSFRIVGNPRNEKIYYGRHPNEIEVSKERIDQYITHIKNTPDWLEQVKKKAIDNKRTLDEQLFLDAMWMIDHESNDGDYNNRWERNPRVGTYSFVLLISGEEFLPQIPNQVKNIGLKLTDTTYLDPYYYLLKKISIQNNIEVIKSQKVLKTSAKFDLATGIYVNQLRYDKLITDSSYFNSTCGTSTKLYRYAQFQQYFHNIDKHFTFKNIPLADDVVNDDYTRKQYHDNIARFNEDELIDDIIRITDCPCKTVSYDSIKQAIIIRNPGSAKNFRKENVGIKTRIGFTYGKVTAKVKLTRLINEDNMWNGITNAVWMINQEEKDWNNRRICPGEGYIPKGEIGYTTKRTPTTSYSEIDFEVVKTSEFWPDSSYKLRGFYPKDDPESNHDIMITCTNWDLACRQPAKFQTGAAPIEYLGHSYELHRWDDWYKAVTSIHPENHDSVFSDSCYYFQIDWEPDKIIWRIGRSKDRMKVACYMDYTVTSIPNNQMVMIITQEWHHADWWPMGPYKQNFIPYPKNDLVGEIYEIEIE